MAGFREKTTKEQGSKIFQDLGLMRARVEYNNDPWKIGRVKVRIPSIHGIEGTSEVIPTEDLPWATPCIAGGCGQDFGSFIVPVPGTYVWVMFEDNDTNKPVYVGGIPGKGGTVSRKMNNLTEEESPLQAWETEPGVPEVSQDVFTDKSTGVPERHVIYKSQKGHTIIFDDTDGAESISIIDRLGQIVKFKCPVSVEDNQDGYRRGTASVEKGSQLKKGINPSIFIKTGDTEDNPTHNQIEIFQDSYLSECVNTETGKKTITETSPERFYQCTQKAEIEMLEEFIRIEFPRIKLLMAENAFTIDAFEKCQLKFTEDGIDILYDGEGLHIDKDGSSLKYKDSSIVASKDSIDAKGKEASITGTDAGVKTKDGKAYVSGKEIHLN